MLIHVLYFFVIIQSITCTFPSYIIKCPRANPNAGNCVLNNARKAFAVLIHGDKQLNLPSFTPFIITNAKLAIGKNAEMIINGFANESLPVQISQAKIDLQQKYWYLIIDSKSITLNLNFTITVKESKKDVQAKGRANILISNWYYEYIGYYTNVTINKENYMQISNSKTRFDYENYVQKFSGLTTLDNKQLAASDRNDVQRALNNLEPSIRQYIDLIGKTGLTLDFNTILKLEPESEIFLH